METKEMHEWTNVWNQYIGVLAANLIMFGLGNIIGWCAPALSILTSEDTPLITGPLTNEQLSWIGSFNAIGSLIGSLVFGYIISLIGCKHTTLSLAIPSTIFWLLVYFGDAYYHILLARFCGGLIMGGAMSTIMLYTSEIANDNIRGRLGSLPTFFFNFGILVSYIVGATVDYKLVPIIGVFIPIIFTLTFPFLSNTPQYYLHKDKPRKAESALKFYKGYKGNDDLEDDAIHCEFERLRIIATQRKTDVNVGVTDLCDRDAAIGLCIGMALILFAQCTANVVAVCYAVLIFRKSGISIDPYIASIILAVGLILGSLCSTYLADSLGRKLLNFVSLAGSAVGLLVMAIFQFFRVNGYDLSDYAWTPVICLSFIIFISSAGIMPLMFVCSIEYIPLKVRTLGVTIISITNSVTIFIVLKTFPILLISVGLHGCLFIYAIGCFIGAMFVLFVQKETSGRLIDDVRSNCNGDEENENEKDTNEVTQIEGNRLLNSAHNA